MIHTSRTLTYSVVKTLLQKGETSEKDEVALRTLGTHTPFGWNENYYLKISDREEPLDYTQICIHKPTDEIPTLDSMVIAYRFDRIISHTNHTCDGTRTGSFL